MTPAPEERVRELVRCPRCLGELDGPLSDLSCASCALSFPSVRGVPVLIDEEGSAVDLAQIVASCGTSDLVRTARPIQKRPPPSVATVLANLRRFRSLVPSGGRVLVVGGGVTGHGIADLVSDPDIELVSFDIYSSPQIQFLADGHRIPLGAESVDAVVIQAVLEHVLSPHILVNEVTRVVKPGGLVYAETAFMQHVHEGAHDFTRFTERGHRWLFREFDALDSGPIGGPALQFLWAIDYLVRGLTRSRRWGLRARRVLSAIEHLDRHVQLGARIDAAPAVYFLGRKTTAPSLTETQLLDGYRESDTDESATRPPNCG